MVALKNWKNIVKSEIKNIPASSKGRTPEFGSGNAGSNPDAGTKLITIRNPFLLFLFGWGKFPREVTAAPGLWFKWMFKHERQHHV